MKYTKPFYELTILSTNDIVASSLSSTASLEEQDEFKASISTSLKDIL